MDFHTDYRLVIVDDEEESLKGMKETLSWKKWGYTVVGTASSAEDAINLLNKTDADILLTDIRMGKLSGIDLIDYMSQKYPLMKFVIISGYSDIEYYRKALEYKVFDYILKPSCEADFERIFLKLKNVLDEEYQKREKYEFLKGYWDTHRKKRKENIVKNMLDEAVEEYVEINILEQENNVKFPSQVYMILIDYRENENVWLEHCKEIKAELNYKIKGVPGIVFLNKDNKIALLISSEKTEERIGEIIEQIHRKVWADWRLKICFGVSCCQKIENIKKANKEAQVALNQMCFMENKYVFWFEDLTFDTEYINVKFQTEKLQHVIFVEHSEKIEEEIENVLKKFQSKYIYDFKHIDFLCTQLYNDILLYAETHGGLMEECDFREEFSRQIEKAHTLKDKKNFLINSIKQISQDNVSGEVKSKLVREIDAIIKTEYANFNMSLQYIAERTGKSSNYLSAVYKNELGKNINEEIIYYRMEKAKELVAGGNMKMYKVAENIGYADSSYFAKLFKKYTGLSPAKYREMVIERS